MKPNVIVIGPPASGKTVNAERLRKHFGLRYIKDNWDGKDSLDGLADHLVLLTGYPSESLWRIPPNSILTTIEVALADAEAAETTSIRVAPDANVRALQALLGERSAHGLAKYGTTTERTDLSLRDWLQHQLEELLDGAVYARAAIARIDQLAGDMPAPIQNPEAWPENYAAGYNDACKAMDLALAMNGVPRITS